ncbi:hypothetical protein SPI_03133 [Niveomyces insectorum RCEF 264]|uniref:Uncharacterized protein n=1 Tax=Niveomyces insectorum RCEF 264 TaxID=1081102 RepID=A0A167X3J8_9HYPO|nr:hypothetical protein SPI_03133 [Niveomyces insectorum RCEF 264]
MPSSAAEQWRESWPPAQLHLAPSAQAHDDGDPVNSPPTYQKHNHKRNPAEVGENPLAHFLTPTPTPLLQPDDSDDDYDAYAMDDDDDDDNSSYYYDEDKNDDAMDFELDAGIEDDVYPQPVVRSVSPSSLDNGSNTTSGLSRLLTVRPPTPPRRSSSARRHAFSGHTLDGDADAAADDEDYVHFGTGRFNTFGLPFKKAAKMATKNKTAISLSTPPSPPSSSSSPATPPSFYLSSPPTAAATPPCYSARGRSASGLGPGCPPTSALPDPFDANQSFHRRQAGHSLGGVDGAAACNRAGAGAQIVRRRSPRSWRVPSPEVFSIEEETEEELGSSSGLNQEVAASTAWEPHTTTMNTSTITTAGTLEAEAAAKPKKKRVRFVLPPEEVA